MAIDMHTDVMEWEKALSLAEKLSPQKIGLIAREYAQQLEQTYLWPRLLKKSYEHYKI